MQIEETQNYGNILNYTWGKGSFPGLHRELIANVARHTADVNVVFVSSQDSFFPFKDVFPAVGKKCTFSFLSDTYHIACENSYYYISVTINSSASQNCIVRNREPNISTVFYIQALLLWPFTIPISWFLSNLECRNKIMYTFSVL